MGSSHVVWDWNGTLLDDLRIVIEAVNHSIGAFGVGPIDADTYRDHYTRPVRHFYDGLFGRPVTTPEWTQLNATFHDVYFDLAADAELTTGAMEAISWLADRGWTQSLLSMSPHGWLQDIVDRLGLGDALDLVDGLSGSTGGRKAEHLVLHLQSLDLQGESVVVIGDTPDDVAAARHVGAKPVLFHGGSHHIEVLTAEGVPIAESLVEAAEIAVSQP